MQSCISLANVDTRWRREIQRIKCTGAALKLKYFDIVRIKRIRLHLTSSKSAQPYSSLRVCTYEHEYARTSMSPVGQIPSANFLIVSPPSWTWYAGAWATIGQSDTVTQWVRQRAIPPLHQIPGVRGAVRGGGSGGRSGGDKSMAPSNVGQSLPLLTRPPLYFIWTSDLNGCRQFFLIVNTVRGRMGKIGTVWRWLQNVPVVRQRPNRASISARIFCISEQCRNVPVIGCLLQAIFRALIRLPGPNTAWTKSCRPSGAR